MHTSKYVRMFVWRLARNNTWFGGNDRNDWNIQNMLEAGTFFDDDQKGTIGDTECCCHLGGEVNVAGGIDEVDQMWPNPLAVFRVVFEIQGHASALDCHTAFLLALKKPPDAGGLGRWCRQ